MKVLNVLITLFILIQFSCTNNDEGKVIVEDNPKKEIPKEDEPKDEDPVIAIVEAIPSIIKSFYQEDYNEKLSDEFNEVALDTEKWFRRQALDKVTKKITEEERFVKFNEGKLICYGMEGKGGGIVSKNEMKYGFYSFNWRVTGFDITQKSSYHPSIWSGQSNGNKPGRTSLKLRNWTEIDLVEVTNATVNGKFGAATQADAPCRIGGKKINDKKVNGALGEKAIMKSFYNDDIDGEFHTYGLEYTPEYLQVWRQVNNKWEVLGNKVKFDSKKTGSITTIPDICRSGMFWYLGDLWTGGGDDTAITTMELDWFRLYDLKTN